MRVLMVTPRFLPDTGGVETHVAEVSRRVAAGGHRVRVLTTDLSGRLPAAEVVDDVEVRRVRAWPRGADYYFAPDLYPAVSKGDWDVVHVQSYHTLVAPLAMAGSLSASIPYVLTFHGGGHSSRVRNALRTPQLLLLRPLLVRAAGLVAVAAFEIDDYASRLRIARDRFTLVPNGADLPVLRAQGLENAGAGLLIASVGRLERYKGHQHVISALPRILERRPDARLWIAGSGPYRDELPAEDLDHALLTPHDGVEELRQHQDSHDARCRTCSYSAQRSRAQSSQVGSSRRPAVVGAAISSSSARARLSGSPTFATARARPRSASSRSPDVSETTSGRPRAAASIAAIGWVSYSLARTTTAASLSRSDI